MTLILKAIIICIIIVAPMLIATLVVIKNAREMNDMDNKSKEEQK